MYNTYYHITLYDKCNNKCDIITTYFSLEVKFALQRISAKSGRSIGSDISPLKPLQIPHFRSCGNDDASGVEKATVDRRAAVRFAPSSRCDARDRVNHVGQAGEYRCARSSPSVSRIYDSSPAKITGDKVRRECAELWGRAEAFSRRGNACTCVSRAVCGSRWCVGR